MSEVRIDNPMITRMIANPLFASEFPFLRSMTISHASCQKCRQGQGPTVTADFDGIKRAIASLGTERKRVLKALFGGSNVVIKYRPVGGVATQLTF